LTGLNERYGAIDPAVISKSGRMVAVFGRGVLAVIMLTVTAPAWGEILGTDLYRFREAQQGSRLPSCALPARFKHCPLFRPAMLFRPTVRREP
jgi:hypothetical protein